MRCACIHDLAGLGHCSLTAAMPILAAMGIQPCPVPTAVLSSQTDGYSDYSYLDMTEELPAYIRHWKALKMTFEGIFTGFLGSARQLRLVEDFFRSFTGALKVVDPVMGDNGTTYDTYDKKMCDGMRNIVCQADVITPNLTEAAILLGEDYRNAPHHPTDISVWASRLSKEAVRQVVITGIPAEDGRNLHIAVSENGRTRILTRPIVAADTPCHGSYPGTGDIFASVLTGFLLKRKPLFFAAAQAANFVSSSILRTAALGTPRCEGLSFEPLLGALMK